MKTSKNPKCGLKLRYKKALELGVIGALSVVIFAFQFFRSNMVYELNLETPDIQVEVEEMPPTEQIVRPPVPARPTVAIPTDDLKSKKMLPVS